jgi:methylthioribulose-1-phosphate dehydratase
MPDKLENIVKQLISAGKTLHELGMVPATSGNFSARLGKDKVAITVSGVHKGYLTQDDIMTMDLDGRVTGENQPSAETALHLQLYHHAPEIQCVLHPHSRAATLTHKLQSDRIVLEGYELQKAFEGITTHESTLTIPIFDNDQNILRLARQSGKYLKDNPETKAYIIRGHGFYTWASSVSATLRHCEALEFLLQCELREL